MNECLIDMYDIVPPIPQVVESNTGKIQILESKMKLLESKLDNIEKTINEHNKKMKNFEEKIQDFNIVDLFKNIGGENGSDSNMIIGLINNLDKKFTTKMRFTDEKLTKIDEVNFKTNKDVKDLLNTFDLNKRNFNNVNQNIESLGNKIKDIEQIINSNYKELNDKFNEKLNVLQKNINYNKSKDEEKKSYSKADSTNIISKKKDEKKEAIKLDLENNEKIQEITEHLSEIDKFLKNFSHHIGIDQIKLDISSIKNTLANCSSNEDLKEVKEKNEELQRQIAYLREQFEDFNSDQSDHEEIQNIKRKFESFASKLHEMDTSIHDILNKKNLGLDTKKPVFDSSKYLEIKTFEEFKNQIVKEFNNVNDNFNHIRKLIDNILDSLQNKSSFDDLKALEEDLLAKIEDLRVTSIKKFADRLETNKNIKYLDQQIKQIIEVFIKKNDKDNNWLIAKKPLNGNLCASCESYIGELKDNTNYIPWNKYPNRDVEKLYRLGNGFSKMLQMVQVDENDKKNIASQIPNNLQINEASSAKHISKDDNFVKTSGNNFNRKELPKIRGSMNQTKSYFHTISNINNMNPEEDNTNQKSSILKKETEPKNQPKITKIYRLNKEN